MSSEAVKMSTAVITAIGKSSEAAKCGRLPARIGVDEEATVGKEIQWRRLIFKAKQQ
jgi:hypothetical protein